MKLLLAKTVYTLLGLSSVNAAKPFSKSDLSSLSTQLNGEITVGSKVGQHLLQHSRRLDENVLDYSFVASYAIKFQGCHHISQWNDDAEDEDEVRIQTKRLVRFRLCPTSYCSESNTAGCTKGYGDYVVDMNTFVYSYLTAMADENAYKCNKYYGTCYGNCNGADDDGCMDDCYATYGLTCDQDDDAGDDGQVVFDALDYSQCAQFDFADQGDDADDAGRRLDEEVNYYVGPFCADQGGEIHLGLFTDDTCTTFANGGKNTFYSYAGYELPYASQSLIPTSCMSCGEGGADDDAANMNDQNDADDVKQVCENIYMASGKCETKMAVDYPNEAACTYIEGIKIIREDGVIRTTSTRKSKAAAVCIGLFTTIAVLLGAYVYYLRTKLGRAKINLSSGAMA
mmetsp:Transcript_23771/g.29000  ORF Transcript_23771/g.29000 Transcript_23771/m.29000 type:complete len:398 (-) Transcript_23771:406-1599(-)